MPTAISTTLRITLNMDSQASNEAVAVETQKVVVTNGHENGKVEQNGTHQVAGALSLDNVASLPKKLLADPVTR